MDLYNLSTIFAPTVLRPAKPDFTNAAKAFNEVRLCQLVMKYLLEIHPSKRVVGLTTLREYSPRDGDPPLVEPSVSDSSRAINVDEVSDNLTAVSIEATLNIKMKNRVTSFARTPKNSTGEGRLSLISALASTPSEDDTNYSRQLPVTGTVPKRRLSETDVPRDSRTSMGNSFATNRLSIQEAGGGLP